MSERLENFLQDYLVLLWERAQEACDEYRAAKTDPNNAEKVIFHDGRVIAFYEVLSMLKNYAHTWEIEDEIPGLKEIYPEQLLGRIP
jgi:hypothetical protein